MLPKGWRPEAKKPLPAQANLGARPNELAFVDEDVQESSEAVVDDGVQATPAPSDEVELTAVGSTGADTGSEEPLGLGPLLALGLFVILMGAGVTALAAKNR